MSTHIDYALPSIRAYNKYGVAPSTVRYMVNNLFYYPQEHKNTLHTYFTLCMRTKEFLTSMKDGTIKNNGITFQVIYHKTDPTRLKRKAEYTVVRLSYRIADNLFSLIPTVLVMELKEPEIKSFIE